MMGNESHTNKILNKKETFNFLSKLRGVATVREINGASTEHVRGVCQKTLALSKKI